MPGHTSSHGGNNPGPNNDRDRDRGDRRGIGGMTPGPGPGGQFIGGATPDPSGVAQGGTTQGFANHPGGGGGENPYSGFGGNRPTMSEALVSAAPEEEEEQERKTLLSGNINLLDTFDPAYGLAPFNPEDLENMTLSEQMEVGNKLTSLLTEQDERKDKKEQLDEGALSLTQKVTQPITNFIDYLSATEPLDIAKDAAVGTYDFLKNPILSPVT